MEILVDMPDRYLANESPEQMARRLKLSAALLLFQQGQLSAGAACEMAGVDRYTFLQSCHQHNIPATDYPPEELDGEIAWLTSHA